MMAKKLAAAQKVNRLLPELEQLHVKLAMLSSELKQRLSDFVGAQEETQFRHDVAYWTFVAYTDAVKRLSLVVEQNFHVIETLGLLSVSRYIFEVLVWLR